MKEEQTSYSRGLMAEQLAVNYLRLKGYKILEQRYKTSVGEIDVIARKGGTLVIVEVKNRPSHGQALEAVDQKNRHRIVNATHHYMMENPETSDMDIRFDVITFEKGFSLRHLDNAWMIDS